MDDILRISATQIAQRIRAGEFTAVQVTEAYLARLEAVNPVINAVTVVAPDALRYAREADARQAAGEPLGPLHGVPFSVKDVFAVPGLYSRIDTHIRQRAQPREDAVAVARLRAAGAVLLAKTNCPPNGSGTDAENAIYGQTVNPYDRTRVAGGSSGGDAALVAAGGAAFAIGSDQRGGLRLPAAYCGVSCLKPTHGRVPNTGAYNQPGGLTDPRTQIGPIARHTEDLLPIAQVLSGPDAVDSTVVPMGWRNPAHVDLSALRVAFFVEDPVAPVDHAVKQAVGAAAQALARAGVTVRPDLPLHFVTNSYEVNDFWQDMAGAPGRTWVELFAMWDYFRTDMLQFMQEYDAILCPVDHHVAPPVRQRDPMRFRYTVPFSLTGFPCTVVRTATGPATDPDGLPIGVQIAAHPWREDVAVVLAGVLEREFGGWKESRGS